MRAGAIGLGLAVTSAATFGTSGPFGAALMGAGWTPGGAVTVRIALAALILTVPALVQLRGRWALLRRHWGAVVAYGLIAVAGCQLFFFNAIEHLSVGVALLLEYSGTVLVVAWMWLRHGQRPSRLTVTGGALAIGGLVLVLDLTGAQRVSLVGVAWGLTAAAGLATYFILSAHAGDLLPPIVMAWAGMVMGALTLAVAGLVGLVSIRTASSDVSFNGHHTSWVVPVVGMSLVAAVIAYVAGIGAARRLGPRVASFVGLSEVLFAIVFAWVLLGQRPGVLQAVGGVIVLAGIALVRAGDPDELPAEVEATLEQREIPLPVAP
ncbi:MAG TPA: DMT family transporter [Jatrophihabitans sp.]|jgi:drug/metabolite transporter (DMT)-like permease|uniref:EamA family transporter n=1 Tax=Jatrophihabitans sp. TaxID=1932789 RepID=UPI002E02ED7A|nr:DMT family transporter [Jatrophihabitans sp.]